MKRPSSLRSKTMAAVKSKGNKTTEKRLIEIFRERGIKGWRRNVPLFGKPDFVFPKKRLVIFADGCFWHGCQTCKRNLKPSANAPYWTKKIARNQKRDRLVMRTLRKKGWRVIRVWEHALKKGSSFTI